MRPQPGPGFLADLFFQLADMFLGDLVGGCFPGTVRDQDELSLVVSSSDLSDVHEDNGEIKFFGDLFRTQQNRGFLVHERGPVFDLVDHGTLVGQHERQRRDIPLVAFYDGAQTGSHGHGLQSELLSQPDKKFIDVLIAQWFIDGEDLVREI